MPAKQVFISHISSEGDLASHLKQRLERDFPNMLEIFVSSDRHTIQAGKKWLVEVEKALKSADLEVVLCSKESVGRPWVNFEAGAAWLRGIPVVPVCHSGMTLSHLPVPFSMLQAVECSRPEGLQKLYDVVSKVLGVETPAANFESAAADIRAFEERHRWEQSTLERIENPRILCAASEQYATVPDLGFHLDVQVVESIFGAKQVTVERALTRKRLTELLTQHHFDIVHLVLTVDPESGDLIFSAVDLHNSRATTAKVDKLSPAGLKGLLGESPPQLVVLATCKALALAVVISRLTNMAATEKEISGEQACEWADCFYNLLKQGRPLYQAFDITNSQIDLPIRAVCHHDVIFAVT